MLENDISYLSKKQSKYRKHLEYSRSYVEKAMNITT